MFSKKWYK